MGRSSPPRESERERERSGQSHGSGYQRNDSSTGRHDFRERETGYKEHRTSNAGGRHSSNIQLGNRGDEDSLPTASQKHSSSRIDAVLVKRERSASTTSSTSSSSSSSSSDGHSAKRQKLERQQARMLRKTQKAERKAQEKLQRFSEKLEKRLAKFTKSHRKRPVAAHAFYFFLLEWVNRILEEPEDLKLRRLPTDSRSYHYVTNVKKGERILIKVGCEPGANSWIVKDDNLQLLKLAADPLEEALGHIAKKVIKWEPLPMGTPRKILGKRRVALNSHECRVVGSMLAHVCGDALGAPVEGWRPELLVTWFQQLNEFQALPHANEAPGGLGVYTADTELMLATAKSIIKREIFDIRTLAEDLAATYSKGRPRAYPETMAVILPKLAEGLDYRKAGSYLNPEGHTHNEGLPRMLPVAICFRNAPDEVLMEAVRGASLFSTVHTNAIGSYFAYAKAITLLLAQQEVERFDAMEWLETILRSTECNDVRSRLQLILRDAKPSRERGCYRVPEETREHLSDALQAEAVELLSLVLSVACEFWRTPAQAVVQAVHLGGDTNTLACCVGALMGALHGHEWIPRTWYNALENEGDEGRDGIVRTALLLTAYDFFKPGHIKNNAKPIPYKAGLYNYQGAIRVEKKFGAKETIYSYG